MTYDFEALYEVFSKIPSEDIERVTEALRSHKRIFVHGAGRSGLMLKAFAMRLAQAGMTVYVVGEAVTPAIEGGDLLVLASASGTTHSVCHSAKIAKSVGASILLITATKETELTKNCSTCVYLNAPTKNSFSADSLMGTLFEQSLLLFCDLAVSSLGLSSKQMRAKHANLE